MTQYRSRSWSANDLANLRRLVGMELPMRFIARKLRRPEETVRATAHRVAMADIRRCLTQG